MLFVRGQESRLSDLTPSEDLVVGVGAEAPGSPVFDVSCFGVDENGRLSGDRYFVFYNQQESPEGEIRALGAQGGDSEAFRVNLSHLPQKIQKLVFAITLDGAGTMSQVTRGHVRISAGGSEAVRFPFSGSDFGEERTIIAGELYREDEWRFAAAGRGFDGGLSALLEHFGGEETAEAVPESAAAPRAQGPPTQIHDDHASLDKSAKEASTGRSMPKWESAARDRLRAAIERYSQPLADMLKRDANEGDTRLLVTDLLCDGFGFDKFEDLTTEYRIRGKYVDYGLRTRESAIRSDRWLVRLGNFVEGPYPRDFAPREYCFTQPFGDCLGGESSVRKLSAVPNAVLDSCRELPGRLPPHGSYRRAFPGRSVPQHS